MYIITSILRKFVGKKRSIYCFTHCMHYAWFEDFLKYTAVSNLFIEWFCSSISSTTRRRHVVGKTRHYHDPLRTPIKRRVIDLNRLSLYTIAWCSHTFLKFQRIWVYQCWRNILIYKCCIRDLIQLLSNFLQEMRFSNL